MERFFRVYVETWEEGPNALHRRRWWNGGYCPPHTGLCKRELCGQGNHGRNRGYQWPYAQRRPSKFQEDHVPQQYVLLFLWALRLNGVALAPQVSFHEANAQELPASQFQDNTYDLYTIAFGIRNCTSIPNVLKEAYRVLKPGGTFACLEFSKVENPLLSTYD